MIRRFPRLLYLSTSSTIASVDQNRAEFNTLIVRFFPRESHLVEVGGNAIGPRVGVTFQ